MTPIIIEQVREAIKEADEARAAYLADMDIPKGMAYSPKAHSAAATEAKAARLAIAYCRTGGWRPIAEAPRDNCVVLLCDEYGNQWTDCADWSLANSCGFPPTHFMPLPAAPDVWVGS